MAAAPAAAVTLKKPRRDTSDLDMRLPSGLAARIRITHRPRSQLPAEPGVEENERELVRRRQHFDPVAQSHDQIGFLVVCATGAGPGRWGRRRRGIEVATALS